MWATIQVVEPSLQTLAANSPVKSKGRPAPSEAVTLTTTAVEERDDQPRKRRR